MAGHVRAHLGQVDPSPWGAIIDTALLLFGGRGFVFQGHGQQAHQNVSRP